MVKQRVESLTKKIRIHAIAVDFLGPIPYAIQKKILNLLKLSSKIIYHMDKTKSKFNINLTTNGQTINKNFQVMTTHSHTQFIMN